MPAWLIGILANIVLKGMDLLMKRSNECSDTLCEIQVKFNKMGGEQQAVMRKNIVMIFGITAEDLHSMTSP